MSLLSAVSLFVNSSALRDRLLWHVAHILAATWIVFVHRDLWPLTTFTLEPLDQREGILLWIKIALLTVAAVVVPGFMPRIYVPVDNKVCLLIVMHRNHLKHTIFTLLVGADGETKP